jgi:sulfoxide reductase heme-binding subunit YedZ
MNQDTLIRRILKPTLLLFATIPVALLLWDARQGTLGEDPAKTITTVTGDWTLRLLLLTLSVTPIRRLTGWHGVIRLRRLLGLLTFGYAMLHVATFVAVSHQFDLLAMFDDFSDHPYLLLGVTAFLLLVPLAMTSNNAMVKRLGGRTWQKLHQLVYLAAVLGMLHYLWPLRPTIIEPLIDGLWLFALLGYRLWWTLRQPPPPNPTKRYRTIPIIKVD